MRPRVSEDPDQAGTDQAAHDDQRNHQPVEGDGYLVHCLFEPFMHETDLEIALLRGC